MKSKVKGGLGKKGSTNQYHLQNRIYEGENANAITTAFNPYYSVGGVIYGRTRNIRTYK